ncbi:hypothetical protein [Streptomyces sp. SAI-229]|uniref:hypothetical protein n=1 Tax=Streptomyces sp. SAI-229 TaxID=3377731 RepID=UPI003C7DE3AC
MSRTFSGGVTGAVQAGDDTRSSSGVSAIGRWTRTDSDASVSAMPSTSSMSSWR